MKYLLILLFLLTAQGFSESFKEFLNKDWILAATTRDGQVKAYFNKNELVKRDGKLFVWSIVSSKEKQRFGKSAKELIVTDCKKPYSFKQLSLTFYGEEMGEGNIVQTTPKEALDNLGLQYAVSNTIKEGVIDTACNF